MLDIAIVAVAGFLAALVGAMSGGGAGIIQLVALLYTGLPVNNAVATHIFGDAGFYPPALYNFHRAKQIRGRIMPPIIILNLLATFGGTLLIIKISEDLLAKLIAIALMVALFFIIKDKQTLNRERPPNRIWPVVYFTARFGGYGGVGGNILGVFALIYFRGLTALQAAGAAFLANGLSSLLAVSMLFFTDLIDIKLGIILFIANLIGSWLGSKIAVKKGNRFIRYMIILVAIGGISHLLLLRYLF